MYRIIDSRGSGKTSRLMLLAKENEGVIACSNPEAMKVKAYNYGIVGLDFISYQDALDKKFDSNKPLFIDEMESFVKKAFCNHKLTGYTLSNED